MHLIYHKDPNGNFGDDLNEWFWDEALPGFRKWSNDTYLIGIGTLINKNRLANFRNKKIVIAGAGVGYGRGVPDRPLPDSWRIYSVRGPLSANALGVSRCLGIIDPAAIIPLFPEFTDMRTEGPPIFVPHHKSSARHAWRPACEKVGLYYLDPAENSKLVIRRIASAPYIITEAMHGAIIADAFRVPWIPVRIGPQFNEFKWRDWLESLEIDACPGSFFPYIDHAAMRLKLRRGHRLQSKFRTTLEKPFIQTNLLRCMQLKKHLSNSELLKKRQSAFGEILRQIRADFEVQGV